MKKLFQVLALTLALNFLAIAGGVGWLYSSKKLDREKVIAIKDILFPVPVPEEPPVELQTADPTTQPILKLEELLAAKSGATATEQVQFITNAFTAQMAQLDRRQRELNNQQDQVDRAKEQLARDRKALVTDREALTAREQQARALESDRGFQDTLALYTSMPAKQVKSIFMDLDDATVVQYLQAMEERTAAKIIGQFKTPEETQRIQKILELMRQAQASIKE